MSDKEVIKLIVDTYFNSKSLKEALENIKPYISNNQYRLLEVNLNKTHKNTGIQECKNLRS